MSSAQPNLLILDGRVYRRTEAKRLAVDDMFVPHEQLDDALEHGYAWRVRSHEFTARGDYSTFVESDGTEWSERFQPDETVWLVTEEEPMTCGLCGHQMTMQMCGSAAVGPVPLCHHDTHSCYRRWTIYGERPQRYPWTVDPDSGSLAEDEERDRTNRGR